MNTRAFSAALSVAAASFLCVSSAYALTRMVPADPCALLSSSQLAHVLGEAYQPPDRSSAPRAFPGGVTGTHCEYRVASGPARTVVFIVYVETSAHAAVDTFTKLMMWFGPQQTLSGFADHAYIDGAHALHAQKGAVRYYISVPSETFTPEAEQKLVQLARGVAAEI